MQYKNKNKMESCTRKTYTPAYKLTFLLHFVLILYHKVVPYNSIKKVQ